MPDEFPLELGEPDLTVVQVGDDLRAPAVGDAIGLGTAVDYLQTLGTERIREHERALTDYAFDRLREVPGLTLYGPADTDVHAGVISFTLGDIHPHDVAAILNEENVAVRAGHHCCQPLMDRLDVVAVAG